MKRVIQKRKRPQFLRQDHHKKKKLGKKWRRPKGIQSKLRLGHGGHAKKVSQGYRAPKAVRGMHPSGLKEVFVYNKSQIELLNAKTDGMIIGSSVGMRNKIAIIQAAQKAGVTILNIKDPAQYLKISEEKRSQKKISKEKEDREKTEKKKEALKKAKEKTLEKEVEKTEEERKEEEKKEKDKILIRKEA